MQKIIILFLVLSSHVLGWECGEYDKYSQPVSKHLELASDVFSGTVIAGNPSETMRGAIDVEVEVDLSIKGTQAETYIVTTYPESPNELLALGASYIMFLYGNNEIDFCNEIIRLWVRQDSLERLEEYSNRPDIEHSKQIKSIVFYMRKHP